VVKRDGLLQGFVTRGALLTVDDDLRRTFARFTPCTHHGRLKNAIFAKQKPTEAERLQPAA
jgi:hypothetical protein